ncbi:SAM-dependent methyltransferase, partial [Burkholderia gladioli]
MTTIPIHGEASRASGTSAASASPAERPRWASTCA